MIFNGDADEQDIVHQIVDATGQNPVAHIKPITRAVNEANRLIWSWIFEAYGGGQYDDSNQVNLPSATTALVASQQKYTLPSEALTVRGVSVQDEAGHWRTLDIITLEEITSRQAENEFMIIPGSPFYYRPLAGLAKLYPAPNYSAPASLRVQFDRGSIAFASTDTDKSPGFASEFHGALAAGASYFIAKNKGLKNTALLERDWLRYEVPIKAFYKKRYMDMNPAKNRTTFDDPAAYLI